MEVPLRGHSHMAVQYALHVLTSQHVDQAQGCATQQVSSRPAAQNVSR